MCRSDSRYLLIDDRHNGAGTRPPFLTDAAWLDQGFDVVIRQSATATFPYSVYRKAFTSGSTVTLPRMNSPIAPGYIVVVQ